MILLRGSLYLVASVYCGTVCILHLVARTYRGRVCVYCGALCTSEITLCCRTVNVLLGQPIFDHGTVRTRGFGVLLWDSLCWKGYSDITAGQFVPGQLVYIVWQFAPR